MHAAILFMIGFVAALMINYPQLELQKERILAHSGNAMTVVLLVFAAGIFAGIFSGTKMVDALAQTLVDWIPEEWSHWFPLVVALTSMPLTFVLSNDATTSAWCRSWPTPPQLTASTRWKLPAPLSSASRCT